MAKSEDRFLVRASQDVSLDGEIWGAEVHMSDGSTKTYGIAGGDGQAEAARKEAETARESAETKRAEDEAARVDAESKRAAAEHERAAQQVKNNADQAANNAAAQGLQVVKLNEWQFDPDTLMPTVSGEVGKLYFVPIPSQAMSALAALMDVPAGDGQDNYLEWMSIDGKWERVGMSNATLVGLTTDEIDRIAAGEQVVSESVLGGTGLTYLWAKLKTAFAALTHKHVTGDVAGLDAALGDKATKAELKTVQDSLAKRQDASLSGGAIKLIKVGSVVTVNVAGSVNVGNDPWSVAQLGTLPSEFKPIGEVSIGITVQVTNAPAIMKISTSGAVSINALGGAAPGNNWVFGNGSYFTV